MRNFMVAAIFVLVSSFSWAAETVSLLDGSVRIALPPGFSQLTAQEMSVKFPRGSPPFAAFADVRRNATIAFTLSRQKEPFTETKLPEFSRAMEQMFPRLLAGLVWHKREIISVGDRKWARLHLSAHAIDTDVKNDMYFTPHLGNILGINLTATTEQWEAAQPALLTAFQSVKIVERSP